MDRVLENIADKGGLATIGELGNKAPDPQKIPIEFISFSSGGSGTNWTTSMIIVIGTSGRELLGTDDIVTIKGFDEHPELDAQSFTLTNQAPTTVTGVISTTYNVATSPPSSFIGTYIEAYSLP